MTPGDLVAFRALTVRQPLATMITLPTSDPWHQRVVNLTKGTNYRGQIAIYASRGKRVLAAEDYAEFPEMVFGAFVAVADLAACFRAKYCREWPGLEPCREIIIPPAIQKRFPWIVGHRHAAGPVCWVLEDVRRLPAPIPYKGRRGLWPVPLELVDMLELES